MSIKDVIKNSFVENFVESISLQKVALSLTMALLFALIIYGFYLFTCDKTIYSKKFNIAMSLMTIITTAVVLAIQANVVVSLGMVGALSIVRFRTAIKEPKDLLFLFWSISNGIILGAGLYSLALVLLVIVSLALLFFDIIPIKSRVMLLVVNIADLNEEKNIENTMDKLKVKYNIKSKNVFKDKVDIMYEINTKNDQELILELSENKKINSMNLIKQD